MKRYSQIPTQFAQIGLRGEPIYLIETVNIQYSQEVLVAKKQNFNVTV